MTLKRATILGVAFLAASCGTRVAPAASRRPDPAPGPQGPQAALTPVQGTSGMQPAPDANGLQTGSPGRVSAAGRPSNRSEAAKAGSPGGPTSVGTAPPDASRPTAQGEPSKSGAASGKAGTASNLPAPTTPEGGSPAVIATVGTLSGPVGATLSKVAEGVQVWVKFINDRGGVNGHPVKHLVYDDGLDPARHRAQVQEAIEVKSAIALVGDPEGITGEPSQAYVTSKRIPVIGSETAGQFFYKSPMYFPQASHGLETMGAAIDAAAQTLVPTGKVQLGTLTCVEAQACEDADRVWAAEAPGLGFHHVYRSRVSIGQPDFTAECLAAQNAKVEVFIAGTDTASIGRLAASCARQGFKPIFTSLSGLIIDRMKSDPNLAGMVGSSNVFPYFQSGTPATDEYQRAMSTYGSRVEPGVGAATGWVAGKLFQRAAANIPEPPTAAGVLAGLWTLRDDTLSGLTQPLTFLENQPTKPRRCWFNIAIRSAAWESPDGFRQHCAAPSGMGPSGGGRVQQ